MTKKKAKRAPTKKTKLVRVKAECEACGATGLYVGMCEKPGTAVVCLQCKGSGCQIIQYTPFEYRKGLGGVEMVYRSKGAFIGDAVGPTGDGITYGAFSYGVLP